MFFFVSGAPDFPCQEYEIIFQKENSSKKIYKLKINEQNFIEILNSLLFSKIYHERVQQHQPTPRI